MNRFKKTVIYAVIISILSGFFISVNAETTINKQSEVGTLLSALNITLSTDTDINKELTRAEAAYLVSKFMNYENTDFDAADGIFADVNSQTDYAGSVELLYRAGVLLGNGNSMFRPSDTVTYSEVITMMVRAMGYKDEMVGSGIKNYEKKASEIGFIRGISGLDYDTGVTYGVLNTIIYNALKCNILKADSYTGSMIEYKTGDTALNEYFDVWSAEGVVTETEVTAIAGETSSLVGEVRIGKDTYIADYKLVEEFLGQNIRFYYKLDDKNDDKIFLYAYDTKSTTVVFDADDIDSYSDRVYTADTGNSSKKYRLEQNADVIYNGRYLYDWGDGSLLVPQLGTVKLVDTTSNGRYDLVIVTSYKVMSVSKIDEDGTLYDKIDYNNTLKTDSQYLTVTDENGYASSFALIKQDDIIFAAQSIDKDVTEIKVSKNTVTGKVESVSSEDGEDYLVINGDRYFVSDYFYKTDDYSYSGKFEAYKGKEKSFRLDPSGKIATYVNAAVSSEFEPGYLLKAYIDSTDAEDELWLKILTKDNEKKNFKVNSNVKVDGRKRGKNAEDMIKSFASEIRNDGTCVTRRSVITYKVNGDNKIIEVDYPYTDVPEDGEAEDSFHKYASYMNNGLQQRNGVLGGRVVIGNPTWVFSVPNNEQTADFDDFEAFSYNFEYDKWIKFDAYSYRKPAVVMDVMVTHESKQENMRDGGGYQLVTNISQCMDPDNNQTEELTVMEGADIHKYYVADGVNLGNIDKGDIVRFGFDRDGKISDIVKYYDCSEDKVDNNQYSYKCETYAINADYANFIGGIYDINNDVVRMFYGNVTPTKNTEFLVNKVSGFKKVVFNTKIKKAEVVNDLSSVTTYKNGEGDYTRVAVSFRQGAPQYMYIYTDK